MGVWKISDDYLVDLLNSRLANEYDNSELLISDSEFESPVYLNYTGHFRPPKKLKPIIFTNCIFNETVESGGINVAGHVRFKNCIFNAAVSLHYENSKIHDNNVINKNLYYYCNSNMGVKVSDISVSGELVIKGDIDTLYISNINSGKEISNQGIILEATINGLLTTDVYCDKFIIRGANVLKGKLVLNGVKSNELILSGSIFESELNIQRGEFKKIIITEILGTKKHFSFTNCEIDFTEIDLEQFNKFRISLCTIHDLGIINVNSAGNLLSIEKTIIKKIEFREVNNNGLVILREVEVPEKGDISFKSSNLGKTDFINCDFSKAKMHFENSKVTEAFLSETEFPKRVFADGELNHGQAQLAFGQLSTAFQKQGDSVRALEYGSRELEAHYRNLKWISPKFPQKLNLWLNHVSNDFGRNWLLGILFSIIVGLVFFCLLLVSVGELHTGILSNDAGIMPAFLKFMNPLRFYELDALFTNTSLNGKVKLNGISYLADFGGRLFLAYGYYQTIQAFRRFGKK